MRLCHPPDGSTSPKYKLLCFITTKKICKEKNALAFNWNGCCHLVLCLRLIPFQKKLGKNTGCKGFSVWKDESGFTSWAESGRRWWTQPWSRPESRSCVWRCSKRGRWPWCRRLHTCSFVNDAQDSEARVLSLDKTCLAWSDIDICQEGLHCPSNKASHVSDGNIEGLVERKLLFFSHYFYSLWTPLR